MIIVRLALCNEVLRDYPFPDQCRLAMELGYEALELAPFTLAEDPAQLTAEERSLLRRIAQDHGISISGLHWVMTAPEGLSITRDDTASFAKARDHMLAMVQLCADLGGSVIVHGSPNQRRLTDGSCEEAARANARILFSIAGQAAFDAGIVYCIEPLSAGLTDYVNTVAEAAAIVRDIGSPGLATMLDTSAARSGEDVEPADILRKWLPTGMIRHIHLNDRNRRAPGQGSDTFGSILLVLQEHAYAGFIGIEPFEYVPSGLAAAAFAKGYVQGLQEQGSRRL